MKEALNRLNYWQAVVMLLLGGSALLWLQAREDAAIALDNRRDDLHFVSKGEFSQIKERMIRLETKMDDVKELLRGMANSLDDR